MTVGEQGFLLLTGYLGDPERSPLTIAQFRELTKRARAMERPGLDREITPEDLIALGCSRAEALRICFLLSQEEQLHWYVNKGKKRGCVPVTRISPEYPDILRKRLGMEAPGSLWIKGDPEVLKQPVVGLVGSRDLYPENLAFAREAGKQAALQGYVLVSGNARGADRTAQQSCLEHGGKIVVVVADELEKHAANENILYISEEGYDLAFSAHRALQRNRIIHSLGKLTLVAQCTYGRGGTWDGTRKNLRHGWSPVCCFRDGSPASLELADMGAMLIGPEALSDLDGLTPEISELI